MGIHRRMGSKVQHDFLPSQSSFTSNMIGWKLAIATSPFWDLVQILPVNQMSSKERLMVETFIDGSIAGVCYLRRFNESSPWLMLSVNHDMYACTSTHNPTLRQSTNNARRFASIHAITQARPRSSSQCTAELIEVSLPWTCLLLLLISPRNTTGSLIRHDNISDRVRMAVWTLIC